jgi:hypothetical protein
LHVDLGYEVAIGTFTYIGRTICQAHTFKKGELERSQTFSISVREAIVESFMNPALREKKCKAEGIYL